MLLSMAGVPTSPSRFPSLLPWAPEQWVVCSDVVHIEIKSLWTYFQHENKPCFDSCIREK